jgi:YfiH family protein
VILRQKDDLFFLQFARLNRVENLCHAVFLRQGGHSQAAFASLNISNNIGDTQPVVSQNRELICRVLGTRKLVFADQNHGDHVLKVTEAVLGDGELTFNAGSGDAMLTNSRAHLVIQTADCQAIMLVDPKRHVVANVHAGWRGSIANIIGKTIFSMTTEYGCRPEDIIAAIGPSLGPCCAEFIHYRREIPKRLWMYKNRHQHFNFWAISRDQLQEAGILSDHIETASICTRCNPQLFFSYRAARVTGRFANVVGFRN